ncbi:MAG: 3-phosphoshikimate 1-carboxyvinyltransferase [Candidatus Gorgyraea atricola]|nr:3-phosphoshikimate 1-carboxyvinyltransferase [Candidatus Gorgyraea atricola]
MKVCKIIVPPDKSISHRAIMLASISKGTTRIKNLLMADDILRTIAAFRAMGVSIKLLAFSCQVSGVGMRGLKKPKGPIYLGNSGTTMRILPGILAGQDFKVVLKGDRSLSKRPMARVVKPLKAMGASVEGTRDPIRKSKISYGAGKGQGTRAEWVCPPLKIQGGKLKAIKYKSKIASAQVKSCVLLAGLYANGVTSVSEPVKSRDHTEKMLRRFGCRVKGEAPNHSLRSGTGHGCKVSLKGPAMLKSPGTIKIPGDISSAAFFIVAGCILPNVKIIIKNVGLNPTRTGIIDILKRMGADVRDKGPHTKIKDFVRGRQGTPYENQRFRTGQARDKGCGDIVVKSSRLRGIIISPKEVVQAIDEIPIIMLAACFAKGTTYIKGIGELRVKETDRVKSMVTNLRKLGADIKVTSDPIRKSKISYGAGKGPHTKIKDFVRGRQGTRSGHIVINGGKNLHGATVSSFGDHRTAMSMLIADLAIKDKVKVTGLSCINKSFPGFFKILKNI